MQFTQDHPILFWGGLIGLLGGIITGVTNASLWMDSVLAAVDGLETTVNTRFDKDAAEQEVWLKLDAAAIARQDQVNNELRAEQASIRSELATQTEQLKDLEEQARASFAQRENRFEELETEHKLILEAIADAKYRIGVHQGEHATENRPP